jgi:hypothetical protein
MRTVSRGKRRVFAIPAAVGAAIVLSACQPDLFVRVLGGGTGYIGKGVFNVTGAGQSLNQNIPETGKAKFDFKLRNVDDSDIASCDIILHQTGNSGPGSWNVKYKQGSANISTAVQSVSGYPINIAEGASQKFKAIIRNNSGNPGNTRTVTLQATCEDPTVNPDRVDVIKMSATLV